MFRHHVGVWEFINVEGLLSPLIFTKMCTGDLTIQLPKSNLSVMCSLKIADVRQFYTKLSCRNCHESLFTHFTVWCKNMQHVLAKEIKTWNIDWASYWDYLSKSASAGLYFICIYLEICSWCVCVCVKAWKVFSLTKVVVFDS